MQSLELLNGRKISIERPRVGGAVHAGQVWRLIVGPRVSNRARWGRSRRHVAKGVEKVRQSIGHTILLQVGNIVPGVVDTPLLEIPPEDLAWFWFFCK